MSAVANRQPETEMGEPSSVTAEAALARARALLATGDAVEAALVLAQAAALGSADANAELGALVRREFAGERAAEALSRRVRASGERYGLVARAILHAHLGERVRAEHALRQAADLGEPRAQLELGTLLAAVGRTGEAEAAFRVALAHAVEGTAPRYAALLTELGRHEEAKAVLRCADGVRPRSLRPVD